jgi:hypothetical protein
MALEQIAWASKIDRFTDVDEIAKTSATKAIRSLDRICPVVGRLYGWMSLHAHWAFEGHVKAMRVDEDGKMQSLFATTEFKARALALTLLMSIIAVQVFRTMRAETLEQALSRPDLEEFDIRSFGSKHRPLNAQLREITNDDLLKRLLDEISSYDPTDADVLTLAEMAGAACS